MRFSNSITFAGLAGRYARAVSSPLCVCLLTLGLSACSTHIRVVPVLNEYGTIDGDSPREVTPLSELVHPNPDHQRTKVVMVFVHGVGDHCPGYALGEEGWVNEAAFRELGIRGARGQSHTLRTPITAHRESGHVQVGVDGDGTLLGNLITTEVPLGQLGSEAGVSLYGVEITWSELTWRLKTKNLNYDFTERGRTAYRDQLSKMSCDGGEARPEDAARTKDGFVPNAAPPNRARINGKLKEEVLDRSLSDAMLYAGPYGAVLQRAVAKGLCDAITMTADSRSETSQNAAECWVKAKEALVTSEKNTLYLFVTHSLGSRMLYDVLRNLGKINGYSDSPFGDADAAAFDAFGEFACKIGAVYMMANQLSLVGLAGGGTVADAIADDPLTQSEDFARKILSDERAVAPPRLKCVPKPMILAFMDTNDLLSWGIRPGMDHSSFDFLTVYVNNSWWHWLYADAEAAHEDYFKNAQIGRLIACGSTHGELASCSDRHR
jgi:hypothetical protein